MGRIIGAVIVGYVVMFAGVFLGLSIAYMALGAEGSFQAGTYQTTMIWNIVMIVVGLLAAIAGGFVCSKIARSSKAVYWLAGLVAVLGLLMAIPVLTMNVATGVAARTGDVPMAEAMNGAIQPAWTALLNPILGAVGAIIGGKLNKTPMEE